MLAVILVVAFNTCLVSHFYILVFVFYEAKSRNSHWTSYQFWTHTHTHTSTLEILKTYLNCNPHTQKDVFMDQQHWSSPYSVMFWSYDATAPRKWAQSVLTALWWLAAVINPFFPNILGKTRGKIKTFQINAFGWCFRLFGYLMLMSNIMTGSRGLLAFGQAAV